MTENAQLSIEIYNGAIVVRQRGVVVKRLARDETGVVNVNLADSPEATLPDAEEWTEFGRAIPFLNGHEIKPEDPDYSETWKNSLYQVAIHRPGAEGGWTWLSIRANDRHWRHDWRHLQRIKNELLGEDVEAIELYPSADRTVDDANQYHLWALPAGERFPVGFNASEAPGHLSGYAQRPLS